MTSLIYISAASEQLTTEKLIELLQISRTKNIKAKITGLLLYVDGSFMQVLEGSDEALAELMDSIEADTRHSEIEILEKCEIPEREFPDWSMAFVDATSLDLLHLPGYSRFLDEPTGAADLLKSQSKAQNLLHYFKSVMMASKASLETLLYDMSGVPDQPRRPSPV